MQNMPQYTIHTESAIPMTTPASPPTIQFNGTSIRLTLPPSVPDGPTHTVTITNWKQLTTILQARYAATHSTTPVNDTRIGTRAAPVQYSVDAITRVSNPKIRLRRSISIDELAKLLAMDLSQPQSEPST